MGDQMLDGPDRSGWKGKVNIIFYRKRDDKIGKFLNKLMDGT